MKDKPRFASKGDKPGDMDNSYLNIKRKQLMLLCKYIFNYEVVNESFKKDFVNAMIKYNQSFKFENNNNNHPTLKVVLKMLGIAATFDPDSADYNPYKDKLKKMGIDVPINFEKTSSGARNLIGINKSQSQALVPLKGLNAENEKNEMPKMTNFKLINKIEIKNLRNNFVHNQEKERVI